MKYFKSLMLCGIGLGCLLGTSVAVQAESDAVQGFSHWIEDFRIEALAAGISQKTLSAALAEVKRPLPRVLELDRSQPELTQSLVEYLRARVTSKRIAEGRVMMKRYPTWLGRVEQEYGVPRSIILALWGIETNYGQHMGSFPLIQSLATLAHDGRRSAYFRKELLASLQILDAGHIRLARMKGSWAGAMGQCQFMPSTFLQYAVDADGNGRADIWSTVPDVFSSAANYLKGAGWQKGQPWGELVTLPKSFDLSLSGLKNRLSLSDWQELGVRDAQRKNLPQSNLSASLILPDGPEGQVYLVYDNFRTILKWNKSNLFAVAVGILSDQILE